MVDRFIAVAEAYVLRSLRSLELRMSEIREAATAVRDAFDTPYGLVSKRIATAGRQGLTSRMRTGCSFHVCGLVVAITAPSGRSGLGWAA